MSSAVQPRRRYVYDPAIEEFQKVLDRAIAANVDPEVIEGLKRALSYVDMREAYTLECTSQESDTCRRIRETTISHPWTELKEQGKALRDYNPMMLSGPLAGQFLKSLVSGQRARRVLDVGMYTGYSALTMAEALPADGEVVTLDMDPYLEGHNKPYFESSPHGKKITIKIGDATASMKEMAKEGRQFDFIFLDADKSHYIDYLKVCFEEGLLAENGTIAVDNAFRHGLNYLPTDDAASDPSRLFGEHVINDKSLHKVLVPVRDGVMLIRRLSEVERDVASQ